MANNYDTIVLGLGAMGSAAAHALARRGSSVLGLEQFERCNDRGSSHGRSRIIRKAYFEDSRYVPMARDAFALWWEIEADAASDLLVPAPCLNIGPQHHPAIEGAQRSVRDHALMHEILAADEVCRRWPIFKCHDHDIGILEPDAGILRPERCIAAQCELAERCGARLEYGTAVRSWNSTGHQIEVQTDDERFETGCLILTAGSWLPVLLADLGLPLVIERQVQFWFRPSEPHLFTADAAPAFIHFTDAGAFYGIPAVDDDDGVKIARHHGGTATTADTVNRCVTPEDEADVRSYIRKHMPQADGPLLGAKVCLYTNTPDDHFIVDRHPAFSNVHIAGGFSGHGFKFAPLIGEILADLTQTGRTTQPIELFALARFTARG